MRSIRRYPRLLVLGAAYVIVAVAGCGSDGDGDAPRAHEGGAGGDAGAPGTSEPQAGEANGKGGRGGKGGKDGSGGTDEISGGNDGIGGDTTPNGEGGANDGPPATAPEFEGIDLEDITLEAAPGCDGGFDRKTGSITLAVDPSTNTVLIDGAGGNLRANGYACTAADGGVVPLGDVAQLNIDGTSGRDTVILDLLEGSLGSSLSGSADSVRIDLGAGDDRLVIRGSRDDDELSCSGEAIDLGGGEGAVTLSGVEGITVSLGPGSDTFRGYATATPCALPLLIYGGDGADVLQGGAADDELNGGLGSDEFEMGPKADGADVLNGGDGTDLVSYGRRTKGLTITLCSSPVTSGCVSPACECEAINGEAEEGDTLVNVEDAEGGEGGDVITGDEFGNVLSGKGGADVISGLGGADQIYGDAGDDIIDGGADDDIVMGGTGVNTIDGGAGDDLCFVSSRDNPPVNCETKIAN